MSREYSAGELRLPGAYVSATSLSGENMEVLSILKEASDLSHGSEELLAQSRSLPNPALLSPEAANFLQPFVPLLRGTALILSDAGPLARFVAELGCSVWLGQPDAELAALASARCRGLDVKIGVTLTPPEGVKFDVIIVSALSPGFDFQPLRAALNSGGLIIAAADNRLASGMIGCQADCVTRASLENDLRESGLNHIEFCLAFPSYKTARLVMSERFPERSLAIEHILAAHSPSADENRWRDVLANGILRSVANSFVAVAGLSPFEAPLEDEVLRIYSTNRRKHFARVTAVQRGEEGLVFSRAPLFPSAKPPSDSDFSLRAYTEPYLAGQSYADLLGPIVQSESWTLSDLAKWAEPWLHLLRSNATEYEFRGYVTAFRRLLVLPRHYVDCIPSNIMIGANGDLSPFDFEYEAAAPLPLHFVAFRGLFYTLSDVTARSGPSASTVVDIVTRVMELCGLNSTAAEIDSFIQTEAAFQDAVAAARQTSTIESMRARTLRLGIRDQEHNEYPAVTVELFWKSQGSQYSSSKSATAILAADQARHVITFVIPAEKAIYKLRLDPSDRPGAFRIHALDLYGGNGESLWSWSGDLHTLWASQSDVTIDQDQPADSGIDTLLVSQSHDPHIELAIGPDLLAKLQAGGRMELAMSWMESNVLNQEKERLMIAENKQLTAVNPQIGSLTNKMAEFEQLGLHLQNSNASLAQTVQDVHEQVARLTAEKQRADRAREAASILNFELQEQLKTVNQELRSVSTDRDLVHGHIRQLQELQGRVEQVEKLVAGIFQGRIWRTLTLLSSPIKILRRKA